MSLRYLPEHAQNALFAVDLAGKEAAHLRYTHRTLFAQPIDADWVRQLSTRDDLAEKIDAFVSRFGRLQDHIGEKLFPRFAALLGESPKSMLDVLAYAEKMQWIESANFILGLLKLSPDTIVAASALVAGAELLSFDHQLQSLMADELIHRPANAD